MFAMKVNKYINSLAVNKVQPKVDLVFFGGGGRKRKRYVFCSLCLKFNHSSTCFIPEVQTVHMVKK